MEATRWQREAVAALVYANVWSLVYFHCLLTPLPAHWTADTGWTWIMTVTALGGALCRITSRRAWSAGAGAALGMMLTANSVFVSDVMLSPWQHLGRALSTVGPYPLHVCAAATAGWVTAHLAARLHRKAR